MPDSVTWDVLVVDNNSKDQTREVIEDFCRRYPDHFRYMFVSRQGKSHALNAALQQVESDVLAFTDDDVIVEPGWLKNLIAPLEDNQWCGAAGRISLGHDFSPPRWMAIGTEFDLRGSLVQFDQGDKEGNLTKAPFGANMAFKASVFQKYGDFRTDLGRNGRSLIGNEDTEFAERVMAAGGRLCYVPTAVVNHPVPPERLTKKYFRAYWYSYGRSLSRQDGTRVPLWKIPLRYLRRFKRLVQWMFRIDRYWFLNPRGRFLCEILFCQTAGEMLESYHIWQTTKPQQTRPASAR
jgi:glucosyl-dolichyl phosphate glucuronosyltransferase